MCMNFCLFEPHFDVSHVRQGELAQSHMNMQQNMTCGRSRSKQKCTAWFASFALAWPLCAWRTAAGARERVRKQAVSFSCLRCSVRSRSQVSGLGNAHGSGAMATEMNAAQASSSEGARVAGGVGSPSGGNTGAQSPFMSPNGGQNPTPADFQVPTAQQDAQPQAHENGRQANQGVYVSPGLDPWATYKGSWNNKLRNSSAC